MNEFSVKNYLVLILPLVLFSILLSEYLLYIAGACVILILAAAFGKKFIIGFVIVSLFTLVGDIDPTLRLIVHLTDFTLLGILFLQKYGFEFNTYKKIPKSVLYFVLLYYAAMLISTLLSDHLFAGLGKIARQTVFFGLVYILYSLLENEEDIRLYLTSIVIASIILIISAIVESGLQGFILFDISSGIRNRVTGLISNIDTTTAFFIISLPIIITSLTLVKSTSSRILHWFLIYLFVVGLVLTTSRSAYLSLIFSSLFIFYFLNRKLMLKFLMGILFVVFLFIVIDPLNEISTLLFRLESGLSQREYFWGVAFNIIEDNWLFGIGPGSYGYKYLNYFPVMLDSWIGKVLINTKEITEGSNNAHSFFLVFFSDMGLPGLFLALSLPVIFFRIGFLTIKKYLHEDSYKHLLAILLTASAGSMFIRGIVDGIGLLAYGFITTDLPFWLMFICLMHLNISDNYNDNKIGSKGVLLGSR